MTIEYTWDLGPLETALNEDGLTNVVKAVHWRLKATSGMYSDTIYGVVSMPDANPEDFVVYEDLTKAQVQAWVEDALGADTVAQYKSNLETSIDRMINPIKVTLPPPWQDDVVSAPSAPVEPPVTPEPDAV